MAICDPMVHDPFELPSQACRNPVDPLLELNPGASTDVSDLMRTRGVDPLSLFAIDTNAPSPLADPSPSPLMHEQPLSDLHPALDLLVKPPAALTGYTHSNHAHELAGQFSPPMPPGHTVMPPEPAMVEASQPAVPPAVAQPPVTPVTPLLPPSSSSSSEELLNAFLEGAGVPNLAGRQPLDAEAMRRLGLLMRAFTDGTIELLSSRALLKREVHAEITMIVEEENNPFKILPNGRAVLMQMFGARMPGFLSPEAAVHDALGDLQSHQLGMVAGMRAALLTLLRRFDPAVLDRTTPNDGSFGEKRLPHGRAARLWRQLQQLHAETTAAVNDDFQTVFGRAFQKAYDREMERLKEARRA
jgi:FHA domain-containing protein